MQILDDLRREHDLIEAVALSFRSFSRNGANAVEAREFLDFFELYAGSWHHDREEHVLFDALTGQLNLPAARGPIHVLVSDHARMLELLAAMRGAGAHELPALAIEYTEALLAHIDVENSVLFPEAADRLRRAAIPSLVSRELTRAEAGARTLGESLVLRYPPSDDVMRGDGCVMCPAYGDSCNGIEREWWNKWQWEEFDEHIAAS